ncbi:MAG: hypothetical protein M3P18_08710 [Actinomycetota bacterium]|nr:hypothetical protein [Actinomycetota bacterium]
MVSRDLDSNAPTVEIYRDVDLGALRQPDLDEVLDEDAWWLPYRDYSPMWGATFEEAHDCLSWERALLARLPQRTHQAEEELLNGALDETDEGGPYPNWGLDLGVGSAVLALSATGCATLISCSGHFGEGHWIDFPMVQFAADAARVEILLEVAESADCGMTNSAQGLVAVWSRTIDEMLDFAEALLSSEARCKQLPPAIVQSEENESDEEDQFQVHPDQQELFSDD